MKKWKMIFAVYIVGLIGGLFALILRLTGRIRLRGWKKEIFKDKDRGILVISNHPGLWEALMLPVLFFPWYMRDFRLVPYSTPDKGNFFDKRWFFPFRPFCVPINREGGQLEAMKRMISLLREGGLLIIFPEGGRTYKGEEFRVSASGKRLKKIKNGVTSLALKADVKIVPLWVSESERVLPNRDCSSSYFVLPRLWRRMTVTVGQPFLLPIGLTREEVAEILENELLKTADL